MNPEEEEFRTYRGYDLEAREEQILTPSMEDYLEMIYRLSREHGHTRVKDLARALNVKPPSVTGMAQRLHRRRLIRYEKYGLIRMTAYGREMGRKLLERHRMLESFFSAIGVRGGILQNVERIEHNLTPEAARCLHILVDYIQDNPAWFRPFQEHCRRLLRKDGGEKH